MSSSGKSSDYFDSDANALRNIASNDALGLLVPSDASAFSAVGR